jgi:hypothetical protein
LIIKKQAAERMSLEQIQAFQIQAFLEASGRRVP